MADSEVKRHGSRAGEGERESAREEAEAAASESFWKIWKTCWFHGSPEGHGVRRDLVEAAVRAAHALALATAIARYAVGMTLAGLPVLSVSTKDTSLVPILHTVSTNLEYFSSTVYHFISLQADVSRLRTCSFLVSSTSSFFQTPLLDSKGRVQHPTSSPGYPDFHAGDLEAGESGTGTV